MQDRPRSGANTQASRLASCVDTGEGGQGGTKDSRWGHVIGGGLSPESICSV